METVNLIESIELLLKKFGRPIVYRTMAGDTVVDRLLNTCMVSRTRTQTRMEPFELKNVGITDRTGYHVLIPQKYGLLPRVDDYIIVPQIDHGKVKQPLQILECLRVTNVMDVIHEGEVIAYNVYCMREDRLRGALGAKG